jgi:precorrin-6A/cobalt-precorrin-6A reductase
MTANAVAAARQTAVPLLVVLRPVWVPAAGDRWIEVASMAEAAQALGPTPRRVLLTVGQKDLSPFATAPWHDYVIRSIEPPPSACLPPRATLIAARGPFAEADELRLLVEQRIDVIVTKNAGGAATGAKLAAARARAVPVVMVARPPPPCAVTAGTAEAALAWLERLHLAARGV